MTQPLGLKLSKRLPALDGLRGLAILMVLAFHFSPTDTTTIQTPFLKAWVAIANFGASGVDLFFVLSGFLITGILLDARGTSGYFRNFFARRALRIFPLYYAVLFACFVILPCLHEFSPDELAVARRQGWFWTYTANILIGRFADWPLRGGRLSLDHLWSLCVEEHFYLIWPLFVRVLGRRALGWTCLAMIAAAPALRWCLYQRGDSTLAFYVWTPCRMDAMAMGAWLALLARRPDAGASIRHWALPAILASSVWMLLSMNDPAHGYVFATSQMILIFAALIVLAVTSHPRQALTRILSTAPLQFFGKYSYAIYLLHPLLLRNVVERAMASRAVERFAANSDLKRAIALLVLGLSVSAIAGCLSWYCFEKHFLKLKKHFA